MNQDRGGRGSRAVLHLQKYVGGPIGLLTRGIWFLIKGIFSVLFFIIALSVSFAIVVVRKAYRVVDGIYSPLEKGILVIALIVMTLAVFIPTLDRKLDWINLGWVWSTKLAMFLMIWVGFLGASIATKERSHLSIDVAGKVLTPKGARVANFFVCIISAGFCFLMAKYSYSYMRESYHFADREGVLPIPLWIIQTIMPVTLFMCGARFIENIFRRPVDEEKLLEEGKRPEPKSWKFVEGRDLSIKDTMVAGLIPGILLGSFLVLKLGGSIGWLIGINCFLLLVLGAPLFVVLGAAISLCVLLIQNEPLSNIPVDMFDAVKKDALLAIPLFVVAGSIMTGGTIARRLIGFARSLVGALPGGFAITAIFACMLFAAICGSAPVTLVAIGGILLPAMLASRYNEDFTIGLLTTSGTIGILIPPSIPMIIYAIVATYEGRALSIKDLFIAGIIPGVMVGMILMFYSLFSVSTATYSQERFSWKEIKRAFREGIFSVLLIPLILLGIYLGWFTVNEAAACAVVYALFVEFALHREMKLRDLSKALIDSSIMMGSLFLVIAVAIAFNKYLTYEQIPQEAAAWLVSKVQTRFGFLIMVNLFLLLLGCLMDIMSAILIVAPILAPIAVEFGINPIHFGIIFILNLQIGYITPPIGINLFVASSLFERPVVQVIRASFPFIFIMLLSLVFVTFIPKLSLLLLGG